LSAGSLLERFGSVGFLSTHFGLDPPEKQGTLIWFIFYPLARSLLDHWAG